MMLTTAFSCLISKPVASAKQFPSRSACAKRADWPATIPFAIYKVLYIYGPHYYITRLAVVMKFVIGGLENIVAKGLKPAYQHFSPFPNIFLKVHYIRVVKTRE